MKYWKGLLILALVICLSPLPALMGAMAEDGSGEQAETPAPAPIEAPAPEPTAVSEPDPTEAPEPDPTEVPEPSEEPEATDAPTEAPAATSVPGAAQTVPAEEQSPTATAEVSSSDLDSDIMLAAMDEPLSIANIEGGVYTVSGAMDAAAIASEIQAAGGTVTKVDVPAGSSITGGEDVEIALRLRTEERSAAASLRAMSITAVEPSMAVHSRALYITKHLVRSRTACLRAAL